MALLPFVHSLPLSIALLGMWAVAHGISFTTIYVLASALTPTALRGGAVAGAFLVSYLGTTVTPPVFFAVLSLTGDSFPWMFVIAAAFAVAPAGLMVMGKFPIRETQV